MKKRYSNNVRFKQDYQRFINSDVWQSIRKRAFAHYGQFCNRCGNIGTDVHHKTYAHFGGNENLEDLEILCRPCHDLEHTKPGLFTPKKRKLNRNKTNNREVRKPTPANKEEWLKQRHSKVIWTTKLILLPNLSAQEARLLVYMVTAPRKTLFHVDDVINLYPRDSKLGVKAAFGRLSIIGLIKKHKSETGKHLYSVDSSKIRRMARQTPTP